MLFNLHENLNLLTLNRIRAKNLLSWDRKLIAEKLLAEIVYNQKLFHFNITSNTGFLHPSATLRFAYFLIIILFNAFTFKPFPSLSLYFNHLLTYYLFQSIYLSLYITFSFIFLSTLFPSF